MRYISEGCYIGRFAFAFFTLRCAWCASSGLGRRCGASHCSARRHRRARPRTGPSQKHSTAAHRGPHAPSRLRRCLHTTPTARATPPTRARSFASSSATVRRAHALAHREGESEKESEGRKSGRTCTLHMRAGTMGSRASFGNPEGVLPGLVGAPPHCTAARAVRHIAPLHAALRQSSATPT